MKSENLDTILIVDDNILSVKSLGITLRKHSFKVVTALNGIDALFIIQKG